MIHKLAEHMKLSVKENPCIAPIVLGVLLAFGCGDTHVPEAGSAGAEVAVRRACRSNMPTIARAVQAKRVRIGASDYSAIIADGIDPINKDIGANLCPDGGTYSLEKGDSGDATTFRVRCSVATHGTFQPGVDQS
jgi:hypothetical protein